MHFMKIAAVAAFLAASAASATVAAQPLDRQTAIEGTLLSVNVEGHTEGRPDMALVNLGVVTEDRTAAAAMAENARRMSALTQALRRAGVAERDIQTSNLSVNPQYVYVENQQPRISGYQASNTVIARVRNIDSVGGVVDAAVAAGGNTVNGVSFTFQSPEDQVNVARNAAAAQARARVELYARAFGLRLHRIISISEGGGYAPPMPMQFARAAMAEGSATPVSPGEITTSVTLSIVYELR